MNFSDYQLRQTNIPAIIYQNPVVSSIFLYNLIKGYNSNDAEMCHMEIIYYSYPLLYIESYYRYIDSTRQNSGLDKFIAKFIHAKKYDLLFRLQDEVIRYIPLVNHTIFMGIKHNMFRIDDSKTMFYISDKDDTKRFRLTGDIRKKANNSFKLGCWLSSKPQDEVMAILCMGAV